MFSVARVGVDVRFYQISIRFFDFRKVCTLYQAQLIWFNMFFFNLGSI